MMEMEDDLPRRKGGKRGKEEERIYIDKKSKEIGKEK